MSVLDELREMVLENSFTDTDEFVTVEDVKAAFRAFEAAHPGLEDHTHRCVVCGGPMVISGNTLVCTADYGRTIGWQHSGCIGKPPCDEVKP